MVMKTTNVKMPQNATAFNDKSLQELAWQIKMSQGQFKLILAHCNYSSVRGRMAQKLQEISSGNIHNLVLNSASRKLYTTLRSELGQAQPQAVMVFSLESVTHLDQLLIDVNLVREEFRKNCPFPLILWVNDAVLKKWIYWAPDLENWKSSTQFVISNRELIHFIEQTADQVFNQILETGAGIFLDNTALELGVGSPRRAELESARRELYQRGIKLSPGLEGSLEFVLGRDTGCPIEQSRAHYERSLSLFKQQAKLMQEAHPLPLLKGRMNQDAKLVERQGCLLYSLGIWWSTFATRHRGESQGAYAEAKDYFYQCITLFETVNRKDLVAKFINALGEVLKRLQNWEDLEKVARQSLHLHQTYPDTFRQARAYGFLAEVALAKGAWKKAKERAQKALSMVNISCSVASIPNSNELELLPRNDHVKIDLECGYHQGWYLFSLAKAQLALGEIPAALETLVRAKSKTKPQYDPELYILILEFLRDSYFKQGEYLTAFKVKQEQRSIEQQYGFRAFIGAGRLQPKQQITNPSLPQIPQKETISSEILAAGRQKDVHHLIEKIGRDDHNLMIIYGPSGVGKSSLLQAGLIPALKQEIIGVREVIPVLQKVYTDWIVELGNCLGKALASHGIYPPETMPLNSLPQLLQALENFSQNSLKFVLIFDQFEEFFFVCKTPQQRHQFHQFLRACLDLPAVNVILSLREDYLHYLLECNRRQELEVINHNILDKNILHYLGNFLPAEAKVVIQSITDQTQFALNETLIDALVQDLAGESGEVSPIELQVVGSQLISEKITTLEEYRRFGQKENLVHKFLNCVVQDCGHEHEQIAKLVLYFLTHENQTRPLKTQAELASDLAIPPPELDLILEIFVRSGLVLLVPQSPAPRYQLVHDYLVSFIRQQQDAERLEELEQGKEKLRLTEAELKRVEYALTQAQKKAKLELMRVEKANQKLAKAQRVAHVAMKSAVIGFVLWIFAGLITLGVAGVGIFEARRAAQVARLKYEGFTAVQQFQSEGVEINTLLSALELGRELKQLVGNQSLTHYPTTSPIFALQIILENIHEQKHLTGHSGHVYGVSFSPDGKLLATTSKDGVARVWEHSGHLLATLTGHQGEVYGISFSPDGKLLATTGEDGTVRLWSVAGELLKTFTGHQGRVYDLSFTPSGNRLITTGEDGSVRLWQTESGQIAALSGHRVQVYGVHVRPDGQQFATTGEDGTIRLWTVSGIPSTVLTGHQGKVLSVSFSPDNRQLATAGADGIVRLWSVNGQLIRQFYAHEYLITGVSFSPNGQYLATVSTDRTVRLWTLSGRQLAKFASHLDWIYDLSFSPDSQFLATAGRDGTARIWELSERKRVQWKIEEESGQAVSFSPTGETLITGGEDGVARLWQVIAAPGEQQLKREFKGHQGWIFAASFSPDGTRIATASADGTARVWHTDGQLLKVLTGHQDHLYSIHFSPDGERVATASGDGTARLWDLDSDQFVELPGHTGKVYGIEFSADGKVIATVGSEGQIQLWNQAGELINRWQVSQGRVYSVSFSPDSQQIATAGEDGIARLWHLSGQKLREWKTNPGRVDHISFSPDGQRIATTGVDGMVRLWSLAGEPIAEFKGHQGAAISLSFSPDGRQFATVGDDGFVRLWPVQSLEELLTEGCRWLQSSLVVDEKAKQLCPN